MTAEGDTPGDELRNELEALVSRAAAAGGDVEVASLVARAADVIEAMLPAASAKDDGVDGLTGLPDRARVYRRVEDLLTAERGSAAAVILLDLDLLKVVNDSLGHAVGDDILRVVAERLVEAAPDGSVGRFGGDEFVVIADGLVEEQDALALAEELLRTIRRPMRAAGQDHVVGASAGIAFVDPSYPDSDALLRDADAALSRAKASGRGQSAVFDEVMRARVLRRYETERELREALGGNQLVLHYQPKLDLETDLVTGAEALIRWEHPQHGFVHPAAVLPVANESGLMGQIDELVVSRTIEGAAELNGWAKDRDITVSLNLSAHRMVDHDLPYTISSELERCKVAPGQLCVEITETDVLKDFETSAEVLGEVRSLGVRVSIDDFGTGHSSLSYLSRLPVDELKIDRSFVVNMDDERGAAVVEGIVGLGRALGLELVAEGVETTEQLDRLRHLGCDVVQGYLIARPGPLRDLRKMVRSSRPLKLAG